MSDALRDEKARLQAEMRRLAHGTMKGVPERDYLINVGRYRAMMEQVTHITERLREDVPSSSTLADEEEGVDIPCKPPPRRKARQWQVG